MNNKNKYINDLIDKGWNEMSDLLDDKLPVSVMKTTGYRTKVAAILILLIGAISGFLYLNSQKAANIAEAANSINANIVQRTVDHMHNSKMVDQKSDKILIENIENNNLTNKNSDPVSIKKEKSYDFTFVSNNAKNNSTDNISGINRDVIDIVSDGTDDDFPDFNADENIKQREIYAIDNLGLNTIANDHSAMKIKDFAPVVSMVKHKVKEGNSLSFGVNAVSENLQSFGGAEFSFLYNYNLIGNIYLNSGLELSYLIKSKMENSFFRTYNIKDPLLNFNTENLDIDSYLANFKSPVLRSIFIDKLLYIGIPLGISVNTEKMIYSVGFKVAYLVSGTNYTSNNEYHYGYNFVIRSPYAFYNSDVYNKLDYGLKIGLGYNLTSRLSINYYLNYSFSWIINSPNYQDIGLYPGTLIIKYNEENRYDKNFYFGLGLKYQMR